MADIVSFDYSDTQLRTLSVFQLKTIAKRELGHDIHTFKKQVLIDGILDGRANHGGGPPALRPSVTKSTASTASAPPSQYVPPSPPGPRTPPAAPRNRKQSAVHQDLYSHTPMQLRSICKDFGLTPSTFNKQKLINMVEDAKGLPKTNRLGGKKPQRQIAVKTSNSKPQAASQPPVRKSASQPSPRKTAAQLPQSASQPPPRKTAAQLPPPQPVENDVSNEEMENLANQVNSLQQDVSKKDAEIINLQDREVTLEDEVRQLTSSVSALKAELAVHAANDHSAVLEKLRTELSEKQTEFDTTNADFKELEEAYTAMMQENNKLSRDIKNKTTELSEAEKTMQEQQININYLQQQMEENYQGNDKEQVEHLTKELETKDTQLQEMREARVKDRDEMNNVVSQNEQAEEKKREIEIENSDLKGQIDELEEKMKFWRDQSTQLEDECAQLRTKQAEASAENDNFSREGSNKLTKSSMDQLNELNNASMNQNINRLTAHVKQEEIDLYAGGPGGGEPELDMYQPPNLSAAHPAEPTEEEVLVKILSVLGDYYAKDAWYYQAPAPGLETQGPIYVSALLDVPHLDLESYLWNATNPNEWTRICDLAHVQHLLPQ